MEVATYISVGAVAAFLVSKLVNLMEVWLSSPSVQQVVKMAVALRDSLPLAVVNFGSAALTVLKPIFTGLVELFAALPPVVVQALHLMGHLLYQVFLFVKNMYSVALFAAKSLYVVLQTANEAFAYVWNFSDNILNPLTNWMIRQPVRTGRWQTIMIILLLSVCISSYRKYMANKRKLKQN